LRVQASTNTFIFRVFRLRSERASGVARGRSKSSYSHQDDMNE
jgi:hypothetical protein